jgi:predicted RNA-binding protein with PIN domain
MRLLIDGYNVIFGETDRPPHRPERELEQMRNDLLERLEAYRTTSDEDITVVFDGGEAGAHLARFQHYGGVEVIFSDPSSDADEEIKEYLHGYSGVRDTKVVTNDRPLAQAAKKLGARIVGTEWLIDRMQRAAARAGDEKANAEPACKFGEVPPGEVERGIEDFGDLDESDFPEDDGEK